MLSFLATLSAVLITIVVLAGFVALGAVLFFELYATYKLWREDGFKKSDAVPESGK